MTESEDFKTFSEVMKQGTVYKSDEFKATHTYVMGIDKGDLIAHTSDLNTGLDVTYILKTDPKEAIEVWNKVTIGQVK